MKFTSPQHAERASTLFLAAALLGGTASADPNTGSGETLPMSLEADGLVPVPIGPVEAVDDFHEALTSGRFWGSLHYRFESVDQTRVAAPFDSEGRASTLQTRLGYETGDFHGMTGVLEFSNVASVPGGYRDYNSKVGAIQPNRPVVADPEATVTNQAYLKYTGALGGDIKVGRQRIALAKHRFIGNVGWRQTEQTFDSLSYKGQYDYGLSFFYAYLDQRNSILATDEDMGGHLINVAKNWENLGTLTAYGYYLDFQDGNVASTGTNQSTATFGGRFSGDMDLGGKTSVQYQAEIARQVDVRDNPNQVSATYSHVYLGGKVDMFSARIGLETLGGGGTGAESKNLAFQTPLSTLHAWNGWADQFLVTPVGGLEDLYFQVGLKKDDLSFDLIFHQFDAEKSSEGSYGSEVNALLTYRVNENMTTGLKFADFNADRDNTIGLEDKKIYWLWMKYSW